MLWHALINVLFVTFFQWRYHIILCLKYVFCLYLTFYDGKRLFISVFSVVFLREPLKTALKAFCACFFVSSKTFYEQQNVFAFVYSLFLMLYSLIFRWGTHVTFSVFPSIHLSVHLSVHPSHAISQELYIIWSWFLVHV